VSLLVVRFIADVAGLLQLASTLSGPRSDAALRIHSASSWQSGSRFSSSISTPSQLADPFHNDGRLLFTGDRRRRRLRRVADDGWTRRRWQVDGDSLIGTAST